MTCGPSAHTSSAPNFTLHYNTWTAARERSGRDHKQACTPGDVNSCGLKLIGGHITHPREESTLWEFKITFMSEHRLCTQSTYCCCVQVHAHTISQSNNAPETSMAQAMSAHCPLYLQVYKPQSALSQDAQAITYEQHSNLGQTFCFLPLIYALSLIFRYLL